MRELLNRLRWDAQAGAAIVELGYAVRGEEGERVESVRFTEVVEILAAGVTLSGGTFIPYHRLRFIRQGGALLWRARERGVGDEG